MSEEFNSPPKEFKGAAEYKKAEETGSFAGNADADEMPSAGSEYHSGRGAGKSDAGSERRSKRNNGGSSNASRISSSAASAANAVSSVVTGFVAAVAVVAVGAVSLASAADVNAGFLSLTVTDTAIVYSVNIDSETETSLIVYNDFTRREVALENGGNEGEITDLKSDMKYTVAVVYESTFGEKTVIEESVRTDAYIPPALVTKLYNVEHECTCNIDGYFHFTLDFIDENGYWSNFSAWLEDAYGDISYFENNGDMHTTQSIDVALEAGLLGNTAQFTVMCDTSDPEAETGTYILYTATVLI